MAALEPLIAAYEQDPGADALEQLGEQLAEQVRPAPDLPGDDPAALWAAVEAQPPVVPGTWSEVRSWRDFGRLSAAEYEYLTAVMESKGAPA
jgi:hypothetical protein